jgi:hypothetical protein
MEFQPAEVTMVKDKVLAYQLTTAFLPSSEGRLIEGGEICQMQKK